MSTSCWHQRKRQSTIKVTRHNPLGTMHLHTKRHGNPFNSRGDAQVWRTAFALRTNPNPTQATQWTLFPRTHTHTGITTCRAFAMTGNLVKVAGRDVYTPAIPHTDPCFPSDPRVSRSPVNSPSSLYQSLKGSKVPDEWVCSHNTRTWSANLTINTRFMCAERCLPTFHNRASMIRIFIMWIHSNSTDGFV